MTNEKALTSTDLEIRALVQSALKPYGWEGATIESSWGEEAGMWFVEVKPSQPGAAFLSVAYDGHDTISVVWETAGSRCFLSLIIF